MSTPSSQISSQASSEIDYFNFEDDSDVTVIYTSQPIKNIHSSCLSLQRKYLMVCTTTGFIITDLKTTLFQRFQQEKSPFFITHYQPHGIRLGSMLDTHKNVALVPDFNSKKYKNTSVYIYDCNIKIILCNFDFNLFIKQICISNSYLIVSNNKRIVIYNYRKSRLQNSQQYYMNTIKSNQNTNFIKYINLYCHLYDDKQNIDSCQCGQFVFNDSNKKLRLFYVNITNVNNVKKRTIHHYDQKTDKVSRYYAKDKKYYDQICVEGDYVKFEVSDNGKYFMVGENFGMKLNVYNLDQNCLYSVLNLGNTPRNIINLGYVNVTSIANKGEWIFCGRQESQGVGFMYWFKLAKTTPVNPIECKFIRSFNMFKNIMLSEKEGTFVNKKFINPVCFHKNNQNQLNGISMRGDYYQLLDMSKLIQKKGKVTDYLKTQEKRQE